MAWSSLTKAWAESTARTYWELPTTPLRPGSVPVPIAVAFTRVTVGNTEWLRVKLTPSWRSRHRFGVSSGVMKSGRRPSSTTTMLRLARPAPLAGSVIDVTAAVATTAARRRIRSAAGIRIDQLHEGQLFDDAPQNGGLIIPLAARPREPESFTASLRAARKRVRIRTT